MLVVCKLHKLSVRYNLVNQSLVIRVNLVVGGTVGQRLCSIKIGERRTILTSVYQVAADCVIRTVD